jgi:hypothetical protein
VFVVWYTVVVRLRKGKKMAVVNSFMTVGHADGTVDIVVVTVGGRRYVVRNADLLGWLYLNAGLFGLSY